MNSEGSSRTTVPVVPRPLYTVKNCRLGIEEVYIVQVIRLWSPLQMVMAMVTTAVFDSPVIFLAVMEYCLASVSAVGVPMMAPVPWSSARPSGSAGSTWNCV